MGTHPIFESDFDCLTENAVSFSGGGVAMSYLGVRSGGGI